MDSENRDRKPKPTPQGPEGLTTTPTVFIYTLPANAMPWIVRLILKRITALDREVRAAMGEEMK